MPLDPNHIFKVSLTSDDRGHFFEFRKAAFEYARIESGRITPVRPIVANVYVKEGAKWERIAQYRNGTKVF